MNLESIIAPATARAVELEDEIERIKREEIEPRMEELRTLNRILNAASPRPKGGRPPAKSIAAGPASKGKTNARYGVVTGAILDYVMKTNKEEFRGVDLRKEMPAEVEGRKISSSNVAEAFAALREDGVIRFVRKEGNSRFYARTGDKPSPDLLARVGRGE